MRYKLEDGTIINDPSYIMPDQWVDDRVAEKIREKYSINLECKMLRLGVNNPFNQDFIDYNKYVEECRSWGKAQKQMYADRRLNILEETL